MKLADKVRVITGAGPGIGAATPLRVAREGSRVGVVGTTQVDDQGTTGYRATVLLGRLNQPEDLARIARFRASDDAAMITARGVEADGGRCI